MYRRRRSQREKIAFSFDSFLDVVANVCGIIIRLILVAWVGGRSYHALMLAKESPPTTATASVAEPKVEEDPLSLHLDQTRRDLDAARARLADQLKDLGVAQKEHQAIQGRLTLLNQDRQRLVEERRDLERDEQQGARQAKLAVLSAEQLQQRQRSLLDDIKKLESQPAAKRELRYRTPVSRAVHADEVFFECRAGRVTFIDLPTFLQEVQGKLEGKVEELRSSWKVEDVTQTVGAFRLRYLIEREPDSVENLGSGAKPRADRNFRYGVTGWVIEPLTAPRGETLTMALAANSEFRHIVDALDATTVITFWVYPDSFELFRGLRDHVYERGLEVAGRPLPEGAPIAASRHGTASRGQQLNVGDHILRLQNRST